MVDKIVQDRTFKLIISKMPYDNNKQLCLTALSVDKIERYLCLDRIFLSKSELKF